MALRTNNFGLIKPELVDPADITAFNENWDKIDEQLLKAGESGGSDITGTEPGTEVEGDAPVVDPTITNYIDKEIEELRESFTDGCNIIIDEGITPHGVTPEGNSPEDIVKAINLIVTTINEESLKPTAAEVVAQKNVIHPEDNDSKVTCSYTPTEDCWLIVYGFFGTQRNFSNQGKFVHEGDCETKFVVTDNVTKVSDGFGNTSYMAMVRVKEGQTQSISQTVGGGNLFAYYEHRIMRIVKISE